MIKLAENNPQGTANIADDRVLGLVFTLVSDNLPPKASNEGYGIYVSKPLFFKTKRKLFTGYYHFGDGYFYSDTLRMHGDSRWNRRITNVVEWAVQN